MRLPGIQEEHRWLAATVGGGFLFRLLFLGRRQLWTDELMQAMVIRASSASEMILRLREGMALPAPLDYFIQKAFAAMLGESAWSLRLHAAILGSLSLWVFYRVALHFFSGRVAVYATILFALYPLHYHYSQEGRPYALLVFLTLVSYDLLLQMVSGRAGPQSLLWLGLILALLPYASFLGLLVIASQWLTVLILSWFEGMQSEGGAGKDKTPRVSRKLAVRYSAVAALACLLFAPWFRFAWAKPLVALSGEVADFRIILRLVKELGDNSYPMSALLILGAVTGVAALRRHGKKRTLVWLLCWLVPSLPAVVILELWSGYFFAIRHILHVTPALLLLGGYGLSYIGEQLRILDDLPHRVSAPAVLYCLATLAGSLWIAQSHWTREPADWRGAASYLRDNIRRGDTLVLPQVHAFFEYYQPSLMEYRVDGLQTGADASGQGMPGRRFVACYDQLTPDPCRGFRESANRDSSWNRVSLRGFSIFVR